MLVGFHNRFSGQWCLRIPFTGDADGPQPDARAADDGKMDPFRLRGKPGRTADAGRQGLHLDSVGAGLISGWR